MSESGIFIDVLRGPLGEPRFPMAGALRTRFVNWRVLEPKGQRARCSGGSPMWRALCVGD